MGKFGIANLDCSVHFFRGPCLNCRYIPYVECELNHSKKYYYVHNFLLNNHSQFLFPGLTAIGIRPQWKRLLTEMQLLQFFIDLIHGVIGFAKHNFCSWAIMYALSMIYLFGTFYIRTYINPKPVQKKVE